MLVSASAGTAKAVSFALDSIAEWGRFPRFCVGVYRWGDKFFNSYDSTHVLGTGYKFNVKLKTDSWTDFYNFNLPQDMSMVMTSRPSTSAGIYLTYLAVSVGYDVNVSKLLTGDNRKRDRVTFGFNCALFSVDWTYVSNDVGTTIRRFGKRGSSRSVKESFNGINTSEWSLQGCYYFNNKRYSHAAAFNLSKRQVKSQGSFYVGFAVSNQRYEFDFNKLPSRWLQFLPVTWPENTYKVNTHSYGVKLGYGYNWVFARNWVMGISESPIIGLKGGRLKSGHLKESFALANRLNMSIAWNNNHWFAGVIGGFDSNLFYDKTTTFVAALLTFEASVGYRFNLW